MFRLSSHARYVSNAGIEFCDWLLRRICSNVIGRGGLAKQLLHQDGLVDYLAASAPEFLANADTATELFSGTSTGLQRGRKVAYERKVRDELEWTVN